MNLHAFLETFLFRLKNAGKAAHNMLEQENFQGKKIDFTNKKHVLEQIDYWQKRIEDCQEALNEFKKLTEEKFGGEQK